jgi:putative ABC transport system substrate-binding protein
MKRRQFIGGLAGAAAWPLGARAQQPGRKRRIGVLLTVGEQDPEAQNRLKPFQEALREHGWFEGRNVDIDYRFTGGLPDRLKAHVTELVASRPDVILVNSTPATAALRDATQSIPIVFAQIIDPVGGGIVRSLSEPGGNITGFTDFEFAVARKWLELLKEAAPNVTRATLLWTPSATYTAMMRIAEETAPLLGVDLTSNDVRDAEAIQEAIGKSAGNRNVGLVIIPTPQNTAHRNLITALAIRHAIPTIFPFRHFVLGGGLISYGPHLPDMYRRSASYIDRILKGAAPKDLPIQAPSKFELVVNLTTAKAIGLTIPHSLLARADEVIE